MFLPFSPSSSLSVFLSLPPGLLSLPPLSRTMPHDLSLSPVRCKQVKHFLLIGCLGMLIGSCVFLWLSMSRPKSSLPHVLMFMAGKKKIVAPQVHLREAHSRMCSCAWCVEILKKSENVTFSRDLDVVV